MIALLKRLFAKFCYKPQIVEIIADPLTWEGTDMNIFEEVFRHEIEEGTIYDSPSS